MKTIEDAAIEFVDLHIDPNEYDLHEKEEKLKLAFYTGVKFAQQWISIKDELPPRKTKIVKQPNGNTLYFYENYLVKGFWNNEAKSEEIRMATYLPCSACWYFDVHKSVKTLNFTVTHWRPIEYK